MFKNLGFNRYLDASDVSDQIVLDGFNCNITKFNLHDGEAAIGSRRFLLNHFLNRQSALLFMNGTVTAIKELSQAFYLFDSHSKNRWGLAGSDGSSVLLRFSGLEHAQNYIQVIH